MDDIDVLQDVTVFSVAVSSSEVLVDLYGGPSNMCGSARFRIPDPAERSVVAGTLESWGRQEVPLTLIARGRWISLQHSQAAFSAQLPPWPR